MRIANLSTLCVVLTFLLAASMQSCGGGGGGGGDNNPDPVPTEKDAISGVASKGPISGATVRIYRVTSSGSTGTLIAETTTNSTGSYSVEFDAESNPVIVRVTAGSYFDEQSGNAVSSRLGLAAEWVRVDDCSTALLE